MKNEDYEDYIRSIIGNSTDNIYTSNNDRNSEMDFFDSTELEDYYPEIYRVVYPMIMKKCNSLRGDFGKDDIERMTDEIFMNIEGNNNDIDVNINMRAQTNTISANKPKNNVRETRQIRNSTLRDLIKILLIRELIGRPRPPRPRPIPPRPGPGGPRPPMRPNMPRNDFY